MACTSVDRRIIKWREILGAILPKRLMREIAETIEVDVLIVGAGTSGTAAFASACEEIAATGNRVLMIEKKKSGNGIRAMMGFVNTKLSKRYGVSIDRQAYVLDHLKYNLNHCDSRLLHIFANESGFVGNWLMDICEKDGMIFTLEYNTGTPYNYKVWPVGHQASSLDYDGKPIPCDVTVPLLKYGERLGGQYRRQTAMKYLEKDGTGRVTGLIAANKDGDYIRINAKKGVMLCTGGYVRNLELLKDRQPEVFKGLTMVFGWPGCDGDGFKAAYWVGAQPSDVPSCVLFDRGITTPDGEIGNPVLNADKRWGMASQPFLKVNAMGERFMNESCLYDMVIHAAAYQPGRCWYPIWDSNWAEQMAEFQTNGCSAIISRRGGAAVPINYTDVATEDEFAGYVAREKENISKQMEMQIAEGRIVRADTLEELAEKLLLPVNTFVKTVKRYNQLAYKGVDEDFGKERHRMKPLDKAPFYGCKMGAWALCTFDGMKQSVRHELLDADGMPIPGLYVGGVDGGSVFCGSYPNLSTGMCCGHSLTYGYRAGKIISHNDDPSYELCIPYTE